MHRALLRQLKRAAGIEGEARLDDVLAELAGMAAKAGQSADLSPEAARLLAGLGTLLNRVDGAYEQFDRDLELRTRSLELSSDELTQANDRLRSDIAGRERALQSMRKTIADLVGSAVQHDDPAAGRRDDLELLSEQLAELVRQREGERRELDNQKFALDQHAIVSMTDTQGTILYANNRFCELSGYDREELLGKNHRIVNSGVHDAAVFANMWSTITRGRVWHGELCNRKKNGDIYWVNATIVPFLGDDGKPQQYIAIRTDITESKLLEERIAASERQYRSVVESLKEVIFRVDAAGRFTYLNPAWTATTGFDAAETLGTALLDYVHHSDRAVAQRLFANLASDPDASFEQEMRFCTRAGDYRWITVFGRRENAADAAGRDAPGFAGTLNDVTDRHLAIAQIEEQLHFARELIEAIPLPVYLKGVDGRYIGFNKAFEELVEVRREDWIGKTVHDLFSEEDARYHEERDQQLFAAGGSQAYDAVITSRSSGQHRDTLYRKAVLTRADGTITGLVGTIIDISDRKQAERILLQAKEAAESANRSKSEFLANMSHEIRTPMNGIIGMTDLALDTELTDEQRDYMQIVKSSAESLLTIINDILDFSKIEAGKLLIENIPFDLPRLVAETLKTMALRADQKGLELVCDIDPDLPTRLTGDAGRIRQILVNLVGNAIKFTERGEVVVRVELDRDRDAGHGDIPVHVSVSDTGIGIPESKQHSIFDAFAQEDSSTTRRYGGTGLGLSISSRLVGMMGGRIWVESRVGEGSRFHFTMSLPPSAESAPPPRRRTDLTGLRMLVVDDNAANRKVLENMLGKWGAVATSVVSGESALELLQGPQRPFDVILLDGHMPGLDGFATAERMLALPAAAGVPIIMLSSGAMRGDAQRCRDLGMAGYFSKPISPDELFEALHRVLENGARPDGTDVATASAATPAATEQSAGAAPLVTRHSLRDEHRRLNVLLVEDHPINQRLIVNLLEKWGHDVTVANDGTEGVAHCEAAYYDIVFMDMQMPVMDGLDATRRIRQRELETGRPRLTIVAMTANAMQGDRESCIAAGMDDYLAKPIKAKELLEYLLAYGTMNAGSVTGPSANAQTRMETSSPQAAAPDGTAAPLVAGSFNYARAVASAERVVVEIIAAPFVEQYPRDIGQLRKALHAGDAATVARVAHALKGTLAAFGAVPARELAADLEVRALQGALTGLDAVIDALDAQVAQLRPHLVALADGHFNA